MLSHYCIFHNFQLAFLDELTYILEDVPNDEWQRIPTWMPLPYLSSSVNTEPRKNQPIFWIVGTKSNYTCRPHPPSAGGPLPTDARCSRIQRPGPVLAVAASPQWRALSACRGPRPEHPTGRSASSPPG